MYIYIYIYIYHEKENDICIEIPLNIEVLDIFDFNSETLICMGDTCIYIYDEKQTIFGLKCR